jgi:hypothetical protein
VNPQFYVVLPLLCPCAMFARLRKNNDEFFSGTEIEVAEGENCGSAGRVASVTQSFEGWAGS